MRSLPRLLLLLLLVFPATLLLRGGPGSSLAVAQDLTEDEETVEDSIIEDEDDEAEVEEDEPTDLAEDKEEEDVSGEPEASPSADTTILFVKEKTFRQITLSSSWWASRTRVQKTSSLNLWTPPSVILKTTSFTSRTSRRFP